MHITLADEVNLRGSRRCSSKAPWLSNKSIHYITHLSKVHPRIRFRVSRINNQHQERRCPSNARKTLTKRESLVDVCSCLPHHYTKIGFHPLITKQGKGKPPSPVQGHTSKPVMMPNKSQRRSKPFHQPSSFSSSIRCAPRASARPHP